MKSVSTDSQQTLPCFEVDQLPRSTGVLRSYRTAVGESVRHLPSSGSAKTVDISLAANKRLVSTDSRQLMGKTI